MARKKRRKAPNDRAPKTPRDDKALGTFEALLKESLGDKSPSGTPADGRTRAARAGAPPSEPRGPLKGSSVLSARAAEAARARRARAEAARPRELAPAAPPKRKVSEEDLMAEAFEAAGDTARSAKYEGEGYAVPDVEVIGERSASDATASTEGPDADLTGEDLLFVEMMSGAVSQMEGRDKYAQLESHTWVGIRWHDEMQLSRMSASELREHEITPDQRELLKRARRAAPVPVLNVRHYKKREALGEVEAFVLACRAQLHRYARVVHGKGKHSKGDAVLKPAVINWCTHEGADHIVAWAPETDLSGQFGSIVVELVR